MRAVQIITPPFSATAPPTRPVPAPRGVTGMRFSLQSFMIAATSSVLSTSHTASGKRLP